MSSGRPESPANRIIGHALQLYPLQPFAVDLGAPGINAAIVHLEGAVLVAGREVLIGADVARVSPCERWVREVSESKTVLVLAWWERIREMVRPVGPAPMMAILEVEGVVFFEGKREFEGRCEKGFF